MQSRITKNAKGYGYKYTDLSEIHKLLEENGLSYYQFVLTEDGADYVYTVKVDADGNDGKPIRGARVVLGALSGGKSNAAQDYGSALTYARRYSLLMAYGLATTDDDAASLTVQNKQKPQQNQNVADAELRAKVLEHINKHLSGAQIRAVMEQYRLQNVEDMDIATCKAYIEWRKQKGDWNE